MRKGKILAITAGLLISVVLPVIFLIFNKVWFFVTNVYLFLATAFIWFTLIILFVSLMKKKKIYPDLDEKYTVMIPVFNEDPKDFVRTVESVVKAKGDKNIMIVDDGSTNEIWPSIVLLKQRHKEITHIHRFIENKGKRDAQAWMIKRARTNILVTIDSDLVFDKDAFQHVINPLQDQSIGLSTGRVCINKEFEKYLYRIQGILWWCADNIGRKSMGSFGIMACACGTTIAFRRSDFIHWLDCYTNQTYLGKRCMFGDDRWMTNLYLKSGFKVVFAEECKGTAHPKESYLSFMNQQLRWRKSMIRESIWALRNIGFDRGPVLFFYLLGNLMLPLFFLSLIIPFMASVVAGLDIGSLIYFMGAVVCITLIRDLYMVFQYSKRLTGLVPFTIFNLFFIAPLWLVALFTLDNTSWGTR